MENLTNVYAEQSINSFIEDLNSAKSMPGGGSAASICGAMGAALAGMAAHMAVNKPKYAPVADELQQVIETTQKLQQTLLVMAQEDAEVYTVILKAYQLPKTTTEEQMIRTGAIEKAGKIAVNASLRVLEICVQVMQAAYVVVTKGSPMLVTDGSASAILARACQKIIAYNVRINLHGVKDAAFVQEKAACLEKILRQGEELEARVLEETEARL